MGSQDGPIMMLRERLLSAKRASGKTWAELAKRTGYSEHHLTKVGKKGRPNPTLLLVACLAEAMNVHPAWLAGWIDEGGPSGEQ